MFTINELKTLRLALCNRMAWCADKIPIVSKGEQEYLIASLYEAESLHSKLVDLSLERMNKDES